MIVTHTEHTKTVPVTNCWEWMVYAEINDNARKCISDEEYQVLKAKEDAAWRVFWIILLCAVIIWIIVAIYEGRNN